MYVSCNRVLVKFKAGERKKETFLLLRKPKGDFVIVGRWSL